MKHKRLWMAALFAAALVLTACTAQSSSQPPASAEQTAAEEAGTYLYAPGSYTDPNEAVEQMELTPKSQKCASCGKNNFKVALVSQKLIYSAPVLRDCIHGRGYMDQCEDIMMLVWDVCQDCTDQEVPWNSSAYSVKIGTRMICCEKGTATDPEYTPINPSKKEIDSTKELQYPGSQSDPKTAMEVLKPRAQTWRCPVCEGRDFAVELVSEEPIYTEGDVIKCIHEYHGQDEGDLIKMLVRDVCQNCPDPETAWASEPYEYIIGGTLYCHGW